MDLEAPSSLGLPQVRLGQGIGPNGRDWRHGAVVLGMRSPSIGQPKEARGSLTGSSTPGRITALANV